MPGAIKNAAFVPGYMTTWWPAGSGGQAVTTFTAPLEFNYHCAIHAGMKGKIIVTR